MMMITYVFFWLVMCTGCHSQDDSSERKQEETDKVEALLFRQAQEIGSIIEDVKKLIMLQMQHNQDVKSKFELQTQHSQNMRSQFEFQTRLIQDMKARMEALNNNQVQQHHDHQTDIDDLKTLINRQTQQQREMIDKLNELMEFPAADGANGFCDVSNSGSTLSIRSRPITVPCDSQERITILRRVDNRYNFSTNGWEQYKIGFGSPDSSFWLGLEKLHLLTLNNSPKLRVELQAWDDETRWAEYSTFRVLDEENGYKLSVDGYSGNAGDSLNWGHSAKIHNGMQFSTRDRDNDKVSYNCACEYNGGWWFNSCFDSLLTGPYVENGIDIDEWRGIIWKGWKGSKYSYKKVEMKLILH